MSQSYPRRATLEDLKRLAGRLDEAGVEYLLVGAFALYAHGYLRATEDIDLLVPMGRDTGEKMKSALLAVPEKSASELDPAWFEEAENIRVAGDIVVDILFSAGGETWESLVRYAETVDLDGVPVRTVSLEGLLKTKQTTREKDVADRIVLERALAELRKR